MVSESLRGRDGCNWRGKRDDIIVYVEGEGVRRRSIWGLEIIQDV
jgi:hypothetical protein